MKASLKTVDEEMEEHSKEPETTHQETNLQLSIGSGGN